ncbi:transporter [Clostridium novyi A str. 4552]|uniref:Transporter n=1 Tax=Clostridium novyi A str. 4552 TaxID=1444289 RepID=A0A0A0ICP5_CLONO|nr:YeeE/YedE thiosulfate transporter family protein [Clostridium novyi]KGM98298.1 transporter [Clostridium novyi A str. 4552]
MSNEIDKLINKRKVICKKEKNNQIAYAILLILIAIILGLVLWKNNHQYIACWFIGILIGITMRYSRFCFTGAFRDPFLIGNTKLIRSVLLGMMISTPGFAIIQYLYLNKNVMIYERIPGTVDPVGIHIAIGAFLFGIGMILAGGCSSGVLMRIGEGHLLQWIVLLGFLIGTILGAKDFPFWYKNVMSYGKVIYFPEYIDLKVVTIIQEIVLIILYKIANLYENRY